jgi:flagellar biosynthesis/type III secretory pathway M-ring protein FliF/YscJ
MEHLLLEVKIVWAAAVAMGVLAWTLGAGVAQVRVVIFWVSQLGLVAVAAWEAVRVLEMRVARLEAAEAAAAEAEDDEDENEEDDEVAEARAAAEAMAARVRLGGG